VFDACRNTLKLTQPGSRAVVQSKGFVPVAQENGMLIAYATAEGELASDIGAGAGPYAKVLAEEIVKPGIEAVVMFRAVQQRVRAAIHQERYLGFNTLGDVYLAGRSEQPTASTAWREWQDVKDTTSIAVLERYLQTHKDDQVYAALAQDRIDTLKRARQVKVQPEGRAEVEADGRSKAEAHRQSITSPPLPQPCTGNANALKMARTVEVDATGGPGFGFEQYKGHDFLMQGEVVLCSTTGRGQSIPTLCSRR
jgi:uncharacterized caspase-like protein